MILGISGQGFHIEGEETPEGQERTTVLQVIPSERQEESKLAESEMAPADVLADALADAPADAPVETAKEETAPVTTR